MTCLRAVRGAWLSAFCMILLATGLVLAMPRPVQAQERFTVEVMGAGPDVILLPGLATPRDVWLSTAQALAPHYRLHLVQVRGFGDDPGVNAEGPILEPLVAELAAYIAANAIDRPVVVGHSLGGLAALMLAIGHPDLPSRIVVVDTLPWLGVLLQPGAPTLETVEPQVAAIRFAMVAQAGQPQVVQPESAYATQSLSVAGREQIARWAASADSRVAGQLLYEDAMADLRSDIATITAPIAVLAPYAEPYPTRAMVEPLYAGQYSAGRDVTVIPIGPARHFIMLDQPEAFLAALEPLLRR